MNNNVFGNSDETQIMIPLWDEGSLTADSDESSVCREEKDDANNQAHPEMGAFHVEVPPEECVGKEENIPKNPDEFYVEKTEV